MFYVEEHATDVYDLTQIREAGLLIAGTLSGPETYFEYHHQHMGLQYQLAAEFARHIGARLQMETAQDTASLIQKLENGEIDFIALEIPQWKTRDNTPELTNEIQKWWNPSRKEKLQEASAARKKTAHRQSRPPMKDRTRGIISAYDELFARHSAQIGWDWRLLAAQCYQESGFDPQAESWMGAQGLMQIMPGTAAELRINPSHIFHPETNIKAGVRYIRKIQRSFSDIANAEERIRFTLAAYNGGTLHIQDARALARRDGRADDVWKEVEPYILKLSEPKYYRDPIVKHGYMRGSETVDYVNQIGERWKQYRTYAKSYTSGSTPSPAKHRMKDGKYESLVKSAEEWLGESADSVKNQ